MTIKIRNRIILMTACLMSCLPSFVVAQKQGNDPPVYVDREGIMRWSVSDEELSLFGVNYSVPFAHGYRAVKYSGASHEETIDSDVYHFARLGFNAYRIHVWDIEISDRTGNLIENDHLRLLDYLIMRLKERGIKIVLTTMRNADNIYPESNDVLGWGFSRIWPKYGNIAHHTPEAVAAQQRYVKQFVDHRNSYTGLTYKDDPDIIAFEINNEPHHRNDPAEVKSYVNTMVKAIRESGMNKPVFYNMSHNFGVTEAFLTADIQGGTFQWYPTGLNAGFTQKGNFLPNVDKYPIPFAGHPAYQNKAKLIYEFCPSDVMDNYLYPAMARTFRQAGFQFITHFAYDALATADINSEYKTHYLNFAYTPAKAISMKIAGEVSRYVKRGQTFGPYPDHNRFGPFSVSYERDLAEMVTDTAFYHSNHTQSRPLKPEFLLHVAGTGNSPVVQYEGTGAYFLDKLDNGIWRLEVMPDVILKSDPFDDPHPGKKVTAILWNQWLMKIDIPDLGTGFRYRGINENNRFAGQADGLTLQVSPGIYLLTKAGVWAEKWTPETKFGNITIGEYSAPPPSHEGLFTVNHTPLRQIEGGKQLIIRAEIAGPAIPERVDLYFQTYRIGEPLPSPTMKAYIPGILTMKRLSGYSYETAIPDSLVVPGGGIMYHIVLKKGKIYETWPGAFPGKPGDWSYYNDQYWGTQFVTANSPVLLMDAEDDFNHIQPLTTTGRLLPQKLLVAGSHITSKAVRVDANVNENLLFLREFIGDKLQGRKENLTEMTTACIRIRALNDETRRLQFGFLTTDGYTYAAPFVLSRKWQDIRIPVRELSLTNTALRLTYPQMMDTYFVPEKKIPFDIAKIENWEISTGELFRTGNLSYEVECLWLE